MRKAFSLYALIEIAITALISAFAILIVVIMSIFYTHTTRESAVTSMNRLVSQVNRNVGFYISDIIDVADYARNLVRTSSNRDLDEIQASFEAIVASRDDLVRVAIFHTDGSCIVSTEAIDLPPEDIIHEQWFSRAAAGEGDFFFTGPHSQPFGTEDESVLSYSQLISYGDPTSSDRRAILLIDLNFNAIADIARSTVFGDSGYIYFITNDGEIVYHPYMEEIEEGTFSENLGSVSENVWGTAISEFQDRQRIAVIQSVSQTRWRIVGIGYLDELLTGLGLFIAMIVVTAAALIVLAIPIANIVAKKIAWPLRRLEQEMLKVENGDFAITEPYGGAAEVQALSSSFMVMVSRIEGLMREIKENEETKRKIELAALQAKINPHFLYNTLDSVIWMAESGDSEGVVKMVSALARLFRVSIAKGKDTITLKEELQHVRSYMDIQSMRYKDRFRYTVDLPPELENAPVIKLIIQPIVENSIYHGIKPMQDEGLIAIRICQEGNDIIIEVKDNGVGMDRKTAASILDRNAEHIHDKEGNGIGIINIDERLKLTYGEGYGVTIESELEAGTSVTIRLPRLDDIEPVLTSR